MRMVARLAVLFVVLSAAPAAGQTTGDAADRLVGSVKTAYDLGKDFVIRSAEKMPEAEFGFQPTPEVRSFAQLLGHIANANYMFCANARGVENPSAGTDFETLTGQSDLVRALRDSYAFCDEAYAMPDAQAAETITLFGRERTRMFALTLNAAHGWEHYGNLVTYMRMRGIVPPSSERN